MQDQPFWPEHRYHGVEVLPIEPNPAQTLALSCRKYVLTTLHESIYVGINLDVKAVMLKGISIFHLSNGFRPLRSSNMITPKLKTSLLRVYWPDMPTSGASYPDPELLFNT